MWCAVVTEAVEEDVDIEMIGGVDVSKTIPAAVEAEADTARVVNVGWPHSGEVGDDME